jgi:hypothetical protein
MTQSLGHGLMGHHTRVHIQAIAEVNIPLQSHYHPLVRQLQGIGKRGIGKSNG